MRSPCRHSLSSVLAAIAVAGGLAACTGEVGPVGAQGPSGPAGAACTVSTNDNGSKTITCGETQVVVENGRNGEDGARGADGAAGDDGESCTIADNGNGTKTITCGNGTSVTLRDGTQGASAASLFNILAEMPTALTLAVDSVTIAGTPVVKFSVKDAAGRGAVGLKAGSSGQVRFSMAKFVAGTNGDPDGWQSYITRLATSGSTSATQGTSERTGTLVDNKDGTYTYTFVTDLATAKDPITQQLIGYDATKTHRLVVQMSGTVNGRALPIQNTIFDFVPAGGTPAKREIASTASCNECHGSLKAHGSRYETGYCVVCHNPSSIDPTTGKSVDLSVMVHGIHSARMRAIDDGYRVGDAHFGEVTYPQGLDNCRKCHDGADAATPQGDNWRTKPNKLACGSCHDTVDFATHQSAQGTNKNCALCHTPEQIDSAHASENATPNNPNVPSGAYNFAYEIKEVTVNASNQAVVTFRIKKDGTPLNLSTGVSDLSFGPSFLVAYASPQGTNLDPGEYNNLGRAAGQPGSVSIANLINASQGTLTGPDAEGFYVATLVGSASAPAAFPVNAKMRAVALQGYFTQKNFGAPGQTLARHAISVVKNVTGDTARRQVVDSAKCANCHEWFEGHGGNRVYEVGVCVTCHNPNLTSSGRGADAGNVNAKMTDIDKAKLAADGYDPTNPLGFPEQTNSFKELIHGIHAGEMRSNDFEFVRDRGSSGVYYYDFSEVTFPGNAANCETCHKPGTYGASLPANALVGTYRTTTGVATEDKAAVLGARNTVPNATDLVTSPTASACFSCHDNPLAKAHMEQNGAKILAPRSTVDGLYFETCAVCHGSGRSADVALVHSK